MEIRALVSAMWRSRTGPLLVAAQVAVTLAVLVNVAYLIQQRLQDASRPTGLDLKNTFWVTTQPRSSNYNYATAVQADLAYLNSLPGVVAATTTQNLPQTFSNMGFPFAADPRVLDRPNAGVGGRVYMGSAHFIDAMGLKLIAGRNFAPGAIQPPAADMAVSVSQWASEMIVTQSMAKKLFPDGKALGKTVYTGLINKPAVIVGIVDLMRANPVPAQYDEFATQVVIVPIIAPGPRGTYVVRAQPGRRDEIMAKIDKEFADLQPGRFIDRMEAYDVTAARARSGYRTAILILGVVALCVLLVTVVGIAGLAAFNVATRTRQLGTRRAIGARRYHIVRYFLVENWLTTTSGVALGCILALAGGVQLSRIYQMAQLPLYYLVSGVLLLWVIGLISVMVPALRAASISPAVATRTV